jgi:hypothetical protein
MNAEPTLRQARLVAASLTTPRFRGRAALLRLASAGSDSALNALEMSSADRERAALSGQLSAVVISELDLPSVAAANTLQATRRAARASVDPLADRQPGSVRRRAALLAIRAAIRAARFRVATHGHSTKITYSNTGSPTVTTRTDHISPYQAGLPNAYASKGFYVLQSEHIWQITPEILKVPANRRAAPGTLYLSPTRRIRQSRGTDLRLETKSGQKGGWK